MNFVNNYLEPLILALGATSADLSLPDGTYRLTITDSQAAATRWEIVDAVVLDGTATLTRGVEDTTDQLWLSGSVIYCAMTAGMLASLFGRVAAVESEQAAQALRLVPTGGQEGQALIKASDTDNDMTWGKFAPLPVNSFEFDMVAAGFTEGPGGSYFEGWIDGYGGSASKDGVPFNFIRITTASGTWELHGFAYNIAVYSQFHAFSNTDFAVDTWGVPESIEQLDDGFGNPGDTASWPDPQSTSLSDGLYWSYGSFGDIGIQSGLMRVNLIEPLISVEFVTV